MISKHWHWQIKLLNLPVPLAVMDAVPVALVMMAAKKKNVRSQKEHETIFTELSKTRTVLAPTSTAMTRSSHPES